MIKVYQLLVQGRWFSLGSPASLTTKTGRHDIAESGVKTSKIKIKSSSDIVMVVLVEKTIVPGKANRTTQITDMLYHSRLYQAHLAKCGNQMHTCFGDNHSNLKWFYLKVLK